MVETIHSAVTGRARFKVTGLYRSEFLKRHLERELNNASEVKFVSASPLTGNILVIFDSHRIPSEIGALIESAVRRNHNGRPDGFIEPIPPTPVREQTKPPSRRATRRLVKRAPAQESDSWFHMEADSVLAQYQSSKTSGLSEKTALRHLTKYGANLLPESIPRSGWRIFLDQFNSLPVALLSIAAVFSLLTGGLADAAAIIGIVGINAVIGYVTESQAERSIQSLRGVTRPSVLALRDGRNQEIQAENIVPGDILVLKPGSYVAADARLIYADRLRVDESTLTGESMPVEKNTATIESLQVPLADRSNMVFMGTLVTGGSGVAIVVATGRFSEVGRIQLMVAEARAPATPMENQLATLGNQLVLICGGICALIFGIGLFRGYSPLQMLLSSISLAVASVPEGLPAMATTTLALGVGDMRRRRVIIRHLAAVETLGSVQTICLDKTGTLTLNEMTVVAIYAGTRRFEIFGRRFLSNQSLVDPSSCEELFRLIQVGVLCTENEVRNEEGTYVVEGSSTENALFRLAKDSGVDIDLLIESYPLLKLSSRSEDRNFIVTFHAAGLDGKFLAVKGNPEEVLRLCRRQMTNGMTTELLSEDVAIIQAENERMAGKALRVLGLAYSEIVGAEDGDTKEDFIWLGLVAMADPIRNGVKNVIDTFHRAGVDTVMITGDQSQTAYAIGKELSLNRAGDLEILDSSHLTEMDPQVLEALAQKVQVFARVSPANKLQIVQAMQRGGRVVAMTGDGINDGPALKAADIGIAMGQNGTPLARDVADVVLEDDNLEAMAQAISQGRTIYTNIRKSIRFLLATNFSEIMVMFAGLAGGFGQPLTTRQLLWINLISDVFPGLALALEAPEPDVLRRPPRDPKEPIIKPSDFKRITFESCMLAAASLGAYGYGIARYGLGPKTSTLGFMGLTFGQLLHTLSCRSEQHSLFAHERLPTNPYLNAALAGSIGLQSLTLLVPGLRSFLGLTPIGLVDALVMGTSAFLPLVVNESTKGGSR
jgi:P-type Ca2+ transporter type 2C